jgi:hypothetical protein
MAGRAAFLPLFRIGEGDPGVIQDSVPGQLTALSQMAVPFWFDHQGEAQ